MRDHRRHCLDCRRPAALRARQRTLSLPDAIALVVANLIDADAAWTF